MNSHEITRLVSSEKKMKILECRLLQILLGALGVNIVIIIYNRNFINSLSCLAICNRQKMLGIDRIHKFLYNLSFFMFMTD